MTCYTCEQDPCTCQKALEVTTQQTGNEWVVRQCVTPGCTVMIRSRMNNLGDPHCKWCQAGTAYYVR